MRQLKERFKSWLGRGESVIGVYAVFLGAFDDRRSEISIEEYTRASSHRKLDSPTEALCIERR